MQEIIINEQWRTISGYLNYQVSNIGRVRNTTTGRVRKLSTGHAGYLGLTLPLNGKLVYLKVHRLVALEFLPNPNNKPTVDHIDNKAILNNTIHNLRWATRGEQGGNRSKRLNTSSQYKGVSWNKYNSKWCASIKIRAKKIHLGYFKNEEEAALSYNKKAMEYFGEFSKLNVIEHTQDYPPFGSGSSSGSSTK
jgi:hypothetical protein